MYDIFYSGNNVNIPTAKKVLNFQQAQTQALTKMFWFVPADVEVSADFNFDYTVDEWDTAYVNRFLNKETYDGIVLAPKNLSVIKEKIDTREYESTKDLEIIASVPKPFDQFYIDSYDKYLHALETSSTELFWVLTQNVTHNQDFIDNFYFSHDNTYDRKENHAFVHDVNGRQLYNGVFLCSKHKPVSKREIEYRFLVSSKQWKDVVSGPRQYDISYVTTYDDYLKTFNTCDTEMFWIVPPHVYINKDFKFDLYFSHDAEFDRKINHVFKNNKYYDGIILCSKHSKISQREFEYNFITNKKEHDIQASIPKHYDIVFISYQEPTADDNFANLLERFPRAKRVHGVKGIHQAHIAAAELCNTDMIWIVDGDAIIVDDFNFDYQVPKWQHDHVFVWRSKNPVNDMVYGYGGVKLFPRQQTLDVDVNTADMTTSISTKFNAVQQIANITSFNTDPFNTWKSAFRECAKLASKAIRGQVDEETEKRLDVWCTRGDQARFGRHAIRGACAGRDFGYDNRDKPDNLRLINDFDWLKEQFDGNT